MSRDYDLIIFDWDGTLMDSETKIVNCFRAAAADVGITYPGDAAVRDIIGLGLKEAMDALLPEAADEVRAALVVAYREHFLEKDQTEMPFFEGVTEGLGVLHGAGYRLAIATGKARRGLVRVLDGSQVAGYFCASRCADETRSKPHPQMLHEILDETGADPARTVMIGDSTYDMEMARNAGVDAYAVSYGVQLCERLLDYNPVGCAHHFNEVMDWLTS